MSKYRNPVLKQLKDQQVRYAPRDVRLEQIERTEDLLQRIEIAQSYNYRDLCKAITAYRPEMHADLNIAGTDVAHDLRLFVEDLSDSANIDVAHVGQEVLTVEDVSRRYNVSTKTVDRWRDKGLVSRRFLMGGRKRVGFLRSSVEWFVDRNKSDVTRGGSFRQVSADEKEKLIQRARRLAKAGGCPTEIAQRLARRFGRSPETIRYTLKSFDQAHPEIAIFPDANHPLSETDRRSMYQEFRRGTSVENLIDKFGRTRSSLYRIISETRCQILLEQPIDFIDSPEFHLENAGELCLGPAPQGAKPVASTRIPPGLPPYLASLYTVPLLSREEEAYYFRKMNYLKFKATELRKKMSAARPRAREIETVERLIDESSEVKNFLIRSNLRLVVSIAKKHVSVTGDFFEMVSDGNMSLIRAIEKFDYSRGFKFSTYASWAIMKNYARSIPAEHTQLDRFRTGAEEVFQNSTDRRSDQFQQELVNSRQHDVLMTILSRLDQREREIILSRYGLEQGTSSLTLEQVGVRMGVTKERIRQIEARALKKLRQIAAEEKLEIPEL